MTSILKKKILTKIVQIENDIEELLRVRLEVLASGYASATMSSSGGSKSYTRLDVAKITDTISALTKELKNYRRLLSGGMSAQPVQIYTVYM